MAEKLLMSDGLARQASRECPYQVGHRYAGFDGDSLEGLLLLW
jgi:hypothetical protein